MANTNGDIEGGKFVIIVPSGTIELVSRMVLSWWGVPCLVYTGPFGDFSGLVSFVGVGTSFYLGPTVNCMHDTAPMYFLVQTEYGSENQCRFAQFC